MRTQPEEVASRVLPFREEFDALGELVTKKKNRWTDGGRNAGGLGESQGAF